MKRMYDRRGSLLVEVVVASGIIALAFAGFLRLQGSFLTTKKDSTDKVRATYRAEEALEAVRRIRDCHTWPKFTRHHVIGQKYYPLIAAGNDWDLASTSGSGQLIDVSYYQYVTFASTTRDAQGVITGTCSTTPCGDIDTRKVTSTITWGSPVKTVAIDTYLTSWKDSMQ